MACFSIMYCKNTNNFKFQKKKATTKYFFSNTNNTNDTNNNFSEMVQCLGIVQIWNLPLRSPEEPFVRLVATTKYFFPNTNNTNSTNNNSLDS